MIYTNCISIKVNLINDINIITEYYKFTKHGINSDFYALIENCSNYSFIEKNHNDTIYNLLKYNQYIKDKVQLMVDIFHIPIKEIVPILQKYLLIKEDFILS
jgi:hypothetical protein